MRAPTISPAIRCPAMTPPNACCGATWRRRLPKVQADLAKQSLGLKVYDCYRPTRAVLAFARWSQQKRRRRDQALLSGAGQARAVRRRLHRRAFGAFDRQRGRSDAGAAPRPACAAVRSARILRRLHRAGRQTRARQCRSTWAPASTASIPRAQPSRAPPRPSRTTGASFCSRPCANAASTIMSANGGTFPSGRGDGLTIFRLRPR